MQGTRSPRSVDRGCYESNTPCGSSLPVHPLLLQARPEGRHSDLRGCRQLAGASAAAGRPRRLSAPAVRMLRLLAPARPRLWRCSPNGDARPPPLHSRWRSPGAGPGRDGHRVAPTFLSSNPPRARPGHAPWPQPPVRHAPEDLRHQACNAGRHGDCNATAPLPICGTSSAGIPR